MKNLIILFCLFLATTSFSQEIIFKNGLYLQNELAYSGKHIVYFASGSVKEELVIKDGKLNGVVVKYYENGVKMEVGNYDNNLKFGLWTRFNTSGLLIAEASYKNDKKDGTWAVYDDKGTKLFNMEYKNGEKVGTWTQWDEDGIVVKTTNYASM